MNNSPKPFTYEEIMNSDVMKDINKKYIYNLLYYLTYCLQEKKLFVIPRSSEIHFSTKELRWKREFYFHQYDLKRDVRVLLEKRMDFVNFVNRYCIQSCEVVYYTDGNLKLILESIE